MRTLFPLLLPCFLLGCSTDAPQNAHDPKFLVPLETLALELTNPDYVWNGPTSREDRIPTLDAACALAYRGDDAAITLFDAVDDPEIEVYSVMDAISELGIPTLPFHDQIMNRDSSGLRKWWNRNRESTLADRNKHRYQIGLPPTCIASP